MEADEQIIEALKVELRIIIADGPEFGVENIYSWASGVVSALCIMGIELSPGWIIDALKEIE